LLASEYGWSREDILEKTALDEVLQLQKIIEKRKIAEYRMLTVIYHADPEKLIEQFDAQTIDPMKNAALDKGGFEKLKNMMAMGGGFSIK
jgi:hypothetical protein